MKTADDIGHLLPQARERAERERARDEMSAVRLGQPVKYRHFTLKLIEAHNALLRRYDALRDKERNDEAGYANEV